MEIFMFIDFCYGPYCIGDRIVEKKEGPSQKDFSFHSSPNYVLNFMGIAIQIKQIFFVRLYNIKTNERKEVYRIGFFIFFVHSFIS